MFSRGQNLPRLRTTAPRRGDTLGAFQEQKENHCGESDRDGS